MKHIFSERRLYNSRSEQPGVEMCPIMITLADGAQEQILVEIYEDEVASPELTKMLELEFIELTRLVDTIRQASN